MDNGALADSAARQKSGDLTNPDSAPTFDDLCFGTPDPCTPYTSDYYWSCERQAGCRFSNTHCEGTPKPCSEMKNRRACDQQYGCIWGSPDCHGTGVVCSEISEEDCEEYSYCHKGPSGCEGQIHPCSMLTVFQCEVAPGCTLTKNP